MKRILIMVLCCLLFVGLCGCGNKYATSNNGTTNAKQTSQISRSQAEAIAKNQVSNICAQKVPAPYTAGPLSYGTFDVTRESGRYLIRSVGTFYSKTAAGDYKDKYEFWITLAVYDDGHISEIYNSVSRRY